MTPRLRSTSVVLVAFALSLGVYAACLRGDVSLWDTGDLQTVPYILGIPYPTGFPGFVLVGWVWTHVVDVGNVAWRTNALSAFASAITVGALVTALIVLGVDELVAFAAALLFAFAGIPWDHATFVDVHPISFAAIALALVFALRWERDGNAADAAWALGCATAAAAIDNTTVLTVPGLALVALGRRPRLAPALRALAIAALALTAVYAYLPLRSAQVTAERLDPTLALGVPAGRPFWDDGHPASLDGFVHVVTGTRFAPQGAFVDLVSPATLRRLAGEFAPTVQRELGEPLLWVALGGAALLWWRAPVVLAGLVVTALLPLLWVFSYPSESDTSRYYLPAYFVLVALAGYGASALCVLPPAPRAAAALTGVFVVVAVLGTDYGASAHLFSQPTDAGASPFVSRVKLLTRSNAVVVAPWMYATPLGYAAYVERRLDRRIVVTADATQYLDLYRRWLKDRPVVVITDDDAPFAGFARRELDHGSPHLYALR